MNEAERQELVEARDTITRQLEILRSPVSYGRGNVPFPPDNQALILKLEEQLAEIKAELSNA